MRRIVYIAALALALVSCTAVKETAEPVVREKTPAERVDSVLLACAGEFAGLDLKDFLQCMDIIVEKADTSDGNITICKDGKPIISVRYGLDRFVVSEFCFGGRVAFSADGGISLTELQFYIAECLLCRTEDGATALVESFNSLHKVLVTLDGEVVGVLRMKTWEKEGILMPAFVLDYDDGASCYLQLVF